MFRRLPDPARGDTLHFSMDGTPLAGIAGDTVAAALLAAGRETCRTTPSGAPRSPYCMMGVCFDCLVTIDGVANRQACLVPIRAGIRVEIGRGAREVRP